MYTLLVYYLDDRGEARARASVPNAAQVTSLIQELLDDHLECDSVVVLVGDRRLFSVDCRGNRMP